MAMLAEPRRRQRIGPNPRGKFYGEQDKNFGKSLLEKMGWKSGEGLGVERQGISEAIRPKIQMSSKGLGYDPKENPWVEHNREFEEILKGLQTEGDDSFTSDIQVKDEKDENSGDDTKKLEKKSKKSRARIHYHKLVKGKDLSRASSDDLKSILGTRVKQESIEHTEDSSVGDKFSSEAIKQEEGNTVNRGSMLDYFQQKMLQKKIKVSEPADDANDGEHIGKKKSKKRKGGDTDEIKEEGTILDEQTASEAITQEEGNTINRGSMVDYFNMKMQQKKIKIEVSEQADDGAGDINDGECKKKRKKSKRRETEEMAEESTSLAEKTVSEAITHEEGNTINRGSMVDYFQQKMQQKKLKVEVSEQADDGAGDINDVERKKKRKKSKRRETEEIAEESTSLADTTVSEAITHEEGNTINRGSMVDYFYQKMQQKKIKVEVWEPADDGAGDINDGEGEYKKKRKKSKRRDTEEITSLVEKTVSEAIPEEGNTIYGGSMVQVSEPADGADNTHEGENIRKKKRKQPKKSDTGESMGESPGLGDNTASEAVQQKKIKIEPSEQADEGAGDTNDGESISKKKRKKSKRSDIGEIKEEDASLGEKANINNESNIIQKSDYERNKQITQVDVDGVQVKQETDDAPPSLEEQLKMEMEFLKNGRQRLKQQYFSSLGTIIKNFKGSNIDKVKGYTLY